MTKEELKKYIDDYRNVEGDISKLDNVFGINIWDSKNPNFYNKYNKLLHDLLVNIFDDNKVDILEEYIWDQNNLTFDELCDYLNVN